MAVACIAVGFTIAHLQTFPYDLITTVQKEIVFLKNDLTSGVDRFLVPYEAESGKGFAELKVGIFPKGHKPELRTQAPTPGYRLLFGAFDFNPPAHAALLLDENSQVVHLWRLNEDAVKNAEVREDANKFPHGMEVLPDGSLLFAYDGGASVQRFDVCSQPLWTTAGSFHHSLSLDIDGKHLWALLENPDGVNVDDNPEDKAKTRVLARLDLKTGEIVRKINLQQVIDANPGIDVLGLHQTDYEDRFEWQPDSFHENDIEPLPKELAAAFPQFKAGDLLISMRALDLIFVMDPDSLKVKWWRIAQTRRQHDADWRADGRIGVYDNNMHRGPLRIVALSPDTLEADVLYDGAVHEAESEFRGRHQQLPNGNLLITVPQQGRVLEVTPEDAIVFEFLNRYRPDPGQNLVLSEAKWLPLDFFDFKEFPSCEK